MGEHITWLLELAVKPGKLDDLRALMDELVESTRAESGAVLFEWFISDDEGTVQLLERYADSAAGLQHVATFGVKFAERFVAAVDIKRFTVLGAPSDKARDALSKLGATFSSPWGGFAR
jgi:quinol monooxygenase YgiN